MRAHLKPFNEQMANLIQLTQTDEIICQFKHLTSPGATTSRIFAKTLANFIFDVLKVL